jgi:hypothetical protein
VVVHLVVVQSVLVKFEVVRERLDHTVRHLELRNAVCLVALLVNRLAVGKAMAQLLTKRRTLTLLLDEPKEERHDPTEVVLRRVA